MKQKENYQSENNVKCGNETKSPTLFVEKYFYYALLLFDFIYLFSSRSSYERKREILAAEQRNRV